MRILVFGKHRKNVDAVRKELMKAGIEEAKRKPDIIISLGGDGTFLMCERLYPGIPKLMLRDSSICRRCDRHEFEGMFENIKRGEYRTDRYIKLEATVNGRKTYTCTNDFAIRNKEPIYAIRFTVQINKEKANEELIGDGIVVSTPFGSTAYFYSITKTSFTWGIGLAFNNITKKSRPLILDEKDRLTFSLERENAVLAMDNNEKLVNLKPGDKVVIKKSRESAKILKLKS